MAKGEWIAPLDDDDVFSPDHLELLLKFALEGEYEMVYGSTQFEQESGEFSIIGSYPLQCGYICHLAVLYHSSLTFFRYDIDAWKYGEPGDWNLWRRMKEAGVNYGFLNRTVGIHYHDGKKKQN